MKVWDQDFSTKIVKKTLETVIGARKHFNDYTFQHNVDPYTVCWSNWAISPVSTLRAAVLTYIT